MRRVFSLLLFIASFAFAQAPASPVVISLDRHAPFRGRSYAVELHADGTVVYNGRDSVRVTGRVEYKIAPEAVKALAREFARAGYFELKDSYRSLDCGNGSHIMVTDMPTYTTRITLDGKTKQVVDYLGAPEWLGQLEDKIDQVAGTWKYVFIDAATINEKVKAGMDVHGKEADSYFFNALRYNDLEVVQALLAAGYDVNAADKNGSTPLMSAKNGKIVRALLAAGAKVNVHDHTGSTPLMMSAQYGEADAVSALLDAGADVNAQDIDGATALMAAASLGQAENVRVLIARNAEINRRDRQGNTALWYAQDAGKQQGLPQRYSNDACNRRLDGRDFTGVIALLQAAGAK